MIAAQRDGDGIYIRFTDGTEFTVTTAEFNAEVVAQAGDRAAAVEVFRAQLALVAPDGFDVSLFHVDFRAGGGVDLSWGA